MHFNSLKIRNEFTLLCQQVCILLNYYHVGVDNFLLCFNYLCSLLLELEELFLRIFIWDILIGIYSDGLLHILQIIDGLFLLFCVIWFCLLTYLSWRFMLCLIPLLSCYFLFILAFVVISRLQRRFLWLWDIILLLYEVIIPIIF